MMAKQSEFFASRTGKIRTISNAEHSAGPTARRPRKQLRLLLPINLAYDVHVGSHGKETEAPYNGPAFGMRGGTI
jgi:hypothetical protein